ncbi:uncharacterized protein LOC122254524 isoform X1 [Penaeus japonicus]|uniref:uncharacterized protein LOC122254524 isoform X1 n=2 Tax=Penaeus japonicus TaxID=27405 RepID=UPI001C70FF22|nr:uncharacterized protein LOC122254524 isoform X1 [Penaeus japonicus]
MDEEDEQGSWGSAVEELPFLPPSPTGTHEMEEFAQLHLATQPASLPDGLLAPRVSTPPVPRPRKAASLSLSSTPKHPNTRHLPNAPPHTNGHDYHVSKGSRSHHQGMQRAPSLDSATHRDLPLSPITRIRSSHSDRCGFSIPPLLHLETEEDSSPPSHRRSSTRLNNGPQHGKHFKKSQQHSYSLPATPRVNGSSQHSGLNGHFPLGTSPSYNTLPYMLPSHALEHSNQENISPSSSHYITCQAGVSHLENSVFLGQPDPKLPGAIDYSSLPLPHEDSEPVPKKQDMSRHLSEPCITDSRRRCNSLTYSPKKKGMKSRGKGGIPGKENGLMDNIKESGQSEGENEEINALEVQWRFIQTLVTELNTTKATNRKLMAELHQAKMEIQVLKASLESYTETGLQPGAITEMVGQIHAAQKVRDEAMMSRIKLANEERDAALTHTRALMDKLSLSPRGMADHISMVETNEQDLPTGGNSSCTSSPRRSDRRHRRPNEFTPSSTPTSTSYTSVPPAFTQGSELKFSGEREVATLAQLATLEEELRTLRLATTIHHTLHEGGEGGLGGTNQGVSRISAEYMEGLCTQLRESEASRWQLHDQCTRLERLVNVLRKKVNGLGVLESGVRTEGTKLTLVDLTLHGPATESPPGSGHHHLPASTSSEGEPKDSLSSLESVETASASSWRRGEVPSITSHSNANLQSSYISQHSSSPHATLNTHLNNHTNLLHCSQTPSNQIQSGQVNSCHSSSSLSPPSSHSPHTSPHHRQQGTSSATDRDTKYIPGVTIVGPITEL